MDDLLKNLDKLIKKYGIAKVLSKVHMRVEYPSVFNAPKGRPQTILDEYWGLLEAFIYFKSKHPYDREEYVANAMLVFLRNYRNMQKTPELWGKELEEGKEIFDKISWLGNHGKKNITEKTIVNKLSVLRNRYERDLSSVVDDVFSQLKFPIFPDDWKDGDDLSNY